MMDQQNAKAQLDLRDRLSAIIARLDTEAKDRVGKRQTVDARMLDDARQYHGRYTSEELAEFKKKKGSRLFINLTGQKTDAMAARLQDLMFPTDDKNWGIKPTPVPEMAEQAKIARDKIAEAEPKIAELEALAAQGDQQAQAALPELKQQLEQQNSIDKQIARTMEEARARCGRMETVIDDQLKECQYHAVMRDVIEDACKYGTGVCKGPVRRNKQRRRWVLSEGQASLQPVEGDDVSAGFEQVSAWAFYPSMDVTNVGDSNGVFQRHLFTDKKLRKLQYEGFNKDALRTLLRAGPQSSGDLSYLQDLKAITENDNSHTKFYQVWEYSGPLTAEEMRDLATFMQDYDTAAEMDDEDDPLKEIQARVWFCQGEVLKFSIYPYDSGEPMYSVFNLKKDESSLFGFGIPYIMRHPQSMLNAAARQMMNNSGAASGPQVVINKKGLQPADGSGDWSLEPFKVWTAKDGIPKDEDYFRVYHIDSHQAELAAIMAIAQKHVDDETGLTALAQGDQGSGITKTAQGMAILINATNIIFRRIVKNFDDDMTVPNIRRMYDWLMQFSAREDIKGDYEVDARGSSVLLAREMQAQNLRLFALEFGNHPVYGPMLKPHELLKKSAQTLMLPADEVIKDKDTVEAEEKQRQEAAQKMAEAERAAGGISPEELQLRQMELQLKQNQIGIDAEKANMDNMTSLRVAELNHQTAMMTLAANSNVKMEEIAAQLQDKREARAFEAEKIKVEQYMTLTTGQTAGGLV